MNGLDSRHAKRSRPRGRTLFGLLGWACLAGLSGCAWLPDETPRARFLSLAELNPKAHRLTALLKAQGLNGRVQLLESRYVQDQQIFRLKELEAEKYHVIVDLIEALGGYAS